MDSAIVESRYRVVLDTDYVEMYTQLVDRQTYPMGALVTEHGWKVSTQFADRADLEAFRDAVSPAASRSARIGSARRNTAAMTTDSPPRNERRCWQPTDWAISPSLAEQT